MGYEYPLFCCFKVDHGIKMSFNFGVDLHDFGIRAGYLPFIGDRFGIAEVLVLSSNSYQCIPRFPP